MPSTLTRCLAVPTYRNTQYGEWRAMLDADLSGRRMPPSTDDEASGYYETGYTPDLAARDLAVVRG